MRIRSIKPEFWRSDDITKLSREDRLLFVGLWQYVDDNGVGIDDYRQITADLFALEDDQNEVRAYVREGLATLARGLLIARYEADGKNLLYIRSWDRHQRVDRPNKSRFPVPDPSDPPPTSESTTDSQQTLDGLATDSRQSPRLEQGNRGTKKTAKADASAAIDEGFAEFWSEYPRKEKKPDGRRAYRNAITKRRVTHDQIMAGLRRHNAGWRANGTERRFIPHPATWLNGDCFNDEPADFGQAALSAVPDLPVTFDDIRASGDLEQLGRLLGRSVYAPSQPPSDQTPPAQWRHDRAVELIDNHETEIRNALGRRAG